VKLFNFTIIKLVFCLITGILLGYYLDITPKSSLTFSCTSIGLFGIFYLLFKNRIKPSSIIGFSIFIATFSIGILTISLQTQRNYKNHYTNANNFELDSFQPIQFRIREVLKPGNYYDKYIVDILSINHNKSKGKCLLNIYKDSLSPTLNVDAIYSTKTNFKSLIPPLNPHQFDYKAYLKKQHIYHQFFIERSQILAIENKPHTIFGYAALLRTIINTELKKYNFHHDKLAIINALVLGQRQDISKTIYNSYTQAGAIHILAVSGLHIGLILIILNFLFKPLEYFKKGKLIKIIVILILLWSYAIIAGLSASVVRAVMMFSIVAIGMHLKRPSNIYNTLFVSIFILLLIKPTFLFDVGFQLSYLAVFAIVIFQPMLYNLLSVKHKLLDYPWQLFTVTLSAQIGIIPISLYYFHQFPGLFFISNLVIIPFLGAILGLGILIMILALAKGLPVWLANFYGATINLMNSFVSWVSQQEAFLFKNLSFSLVQVLFCYTLVGWFLILRKKRTYKNTVLFLVSILLFQFHLLYQKQQSSNKRIIVFHKSRHSIIGIQQFEHLEIHTNIKKITNEKLITNYFVGEDVNPQASDTLQTLYTLGSKHMLVVDSLVIYNIKTLQPDIILLRDSPKLNLARLIDSVKPKLIIADGSNYKSYQERWRQTCVTKKIPFHQTSKKGAYIFKE
jgi:competence protein ComEC